MRIRKPTARPNNDLLFTDGDSNDDRNMIGDDVNNTPARKGHSKRDHVVHPNICPIWMRSLSALQIISFFQLKNQSIEPVSVRQNIGYIQLKKIYPHLSHFVTNPTVVI